MDRYNNYADTVPLSLYNLFRVFMTNSILCTIFFENIAEVKQ